MKYFAFLALIASSSAIHHRAQDIYDSDLPTGLYQQTSPGGPYKFRTVQSMAQMRTREEPAPEAPAESVVADAEKDVVDEKDAAEAKKSKAKEEAEAKEQAEDLKEEADEKREEELEAPSAMAWTAALPEKWINNKNHAPLKWAN